VANRMNRSRAACLQFQIRGPVLEEHPDALILVSRGSPYRVHFEGYDVAACNESPPRRCAASRGFVTFGKTDPQGYREFEQDGVVSTIANGEPSPGKFWGNGSGIPPVPAR